MSFASKLKSLFRRGKLDAEMAEEMQAHLERLEERHRAAGISLTEARYAALRSFGGVDQLKERAREERGLPGLEYLLKEISFSARRLRRSPAFAATAWRASKVSPLVALRGD
jgi:hypothetical protein